VMMWGNRNGYFYVLDRTTGQFLQGTPFVKVTWSKGLDEAGRPMRVESVMPSAEGVELYPSHTGGTNWYSPSFSPRTGLFYVSAWEDVRDVVTKVPGKFEEGKRYTDGATRPTRPGTRDAQGPRPDDGGGFGVLKAIDPQTGERKWEFKMKDVTASGVLTTATDVLFTGGREGYFYALNARNGNLLWKVNAGGEVAMGPMTYQVNGKQYVAFTAGSSLFVYGLK
jgi:alcohol dehydrogenase (cytochrome c)